MAGWRRNWFSSRLSRLAGRPPSWLLLVLGLALTLSACTEPAAAQRRETPPPLLREFRAAWVATVANIDWPSRPGLSTAAARAELDAIVDRAAELRLNALVFQVRPAADAMYRSVLEPWSEWLTGKQGRAPGTDWDPLEYVIDRCHRHGLELHAWFNPFRCGHPSGKSPPDRSSVRRVLPEACVKFGSYEWMDPGDPEAREWSMRVILDVVRRYDVDGVHIDDYFYPYPVRGVKFDDERSYAGYRARGGKLGRSDWRRQNIDDFVRDLYENVHDEKSWVQVGISPFGIARPGEPAGIKAGIDQYEDLYADVPHWLRQGWLDYLAPQLYWPIDQKPQSFPVLLRYWHRKNVIYRHVWPGINPGRCLQQKPPCRPNELTDQIELIRGEGRNGQVSLGHVHFSFKALRTDAPNVGGALRKRLYGELAIAPESPWLGTTAPPKPKARLERGSDGVTVRWPPDRDTRFVAVQVLDTLGWHTASVVGADHGRCTIPAGYRAIAVSGIGRTGIQSPVVVLK